MKKITLTVNPIIIGLTGPCSSKIRPERGMKTSRQQTSRQNDQAGNHCRGMHCKLRHIWNNEAPRLIFVN